MSPGRLAALQDRLTDRRSRRVVFASHCLLNQNVRYLGGACYPGPVDELVDSWKGQGIGICQMPCPEQRAWGGVLKRAIAPAYGAAEKCYWPFRSVLLGCFKAYTRLRYAWLAHRVASEIRDYRRSGYEVAGIVGVAGSPSCGVRTTLDVGRWLEVAGRYRLEQLESERFNREAIRGSEVSGQGWFIRDLTRQLRRSGDEVPLLEHDARAPSPAPG